MAYVGNCDLLAVVVSCYTISEYPLSPGYHFTKLTWREPPTKACTAALG